jgi:hypothetical protein
MCLTISSAAFAEIAMDESEEQEPETRNENQPSLGALEKGDHPQATFRGLFRYPIHHAMPKATAAVKCFPAWMVPGMPTPSLPSGKCEP